MKNINKLLFILLLTFIFVSFNNMEPIEEVYPIEQGDVYADCLSKIGSIEGYSKYSKRSSFSFILSETTYTDIYFNSAMTTLKVIKIIDYANTFIEYIEKLEVVISDLQLMSSEQKIYSHTIGYQNDSFVPVILDELDYTGYTLYKGVVTLSKVQENDRYFIGDWVDNQSEPVVGDIDYILVKVHNNGVYMFYGIEYNGSIMFNYKRANLDSPSSEHSYTSGL